MKKELFIANNTLVVVLFMGVFTIATIKKEISLDTGSICILLTLILGELGRIRTKL